MAPFVCMFCSRVICRSPRKPRSSGRYCSFSLLRCQWQTRGGESATFAPCLPRRSRKTRASRSERDKLVIHTRPPNPVNLNRTSTREQTQRENTLKINKPIAPAPPPANSWRREGASVRFFSRNVVGNVPKSSRVSDLLYKQRRLPANE